MNSTLEPCVHLDNIIEPCAHYIRKYENEAGLCKLDDYYLCIEAIRNGKLPHISHSSAGNFSQCKYKFYLSNILGVRLKNEFVSAAIKMGQLWDAYWGGASEGALLDLIESYSIDPYSVAKVQAMIDAAKDLGLTNDYGIYDAQAGAKIKLNSCNIIGFFDRKYPNFFVETKFSGRPNNYTTKSTIEHQVGTYFLSDPALEYVIMEVGRASAIKYREGEEPADYTKRVYQDIIKRPQFYFMGYKQGESNYGVKFSRHEFDLDGLVDDYNALISDLIWTCQTGNFYQNKASCGNFGGCSFQSICATGCISDVKFTRRKEK